MQQSDFARVTSLLVEACGMQAVAGSLGVQVQTYKQMRVDGRPHGRRPPADWRDRLRPLARAAVEWYRTHADAVSAELLSETLEQKGP